MRIRSPRDFWAGIFFVAVAVAFIWLATGYRYGTAQRMGPGFFPIWVAGVLGLLGVIIAMRSFVIDGPRIDRIGMRQLLMTLVAIVLFGAVLTYVGLVGAIVALVVVGAFADQSSRPLETIALAVALAVFSVLIFSYMLGLPLPIWPEGFLEKLRSLV